MHDPLGVLQRPAVPRCNARDRAGHDDAASNAGQLQVVAKGRPDSGASRFYCWYFFTIFLHLKVHHEPSNIPKASQPCC